MNDYRLDSTGDLDLSSLALRGFDRKEDALRQRLEIRLGRFQGEWHLNILSGVPYLSAPFTDKNNKLAVDNFMKNYIIDTNGVLSLDRYSSDIKQRNLTVTFTVTGESGEIVSFTNLEIL